MFVGLRSTMQSTHDIVLAGWDKDSVVAVEGMDLNTHSTNSGQFLLAVPGGQTFTLNAINPADGSVASRFNVVVRAGETLDVGELDLQACPQPGLDVPAQTDQPQEDARDLQDQS
jgi:hypothetical protein